MNNAEATSLAPTVWSDHLHLRVDDVERSSASIRDPQRRPRAPLATNLAVPRRRLLAAESPARP